MDKEEINEKKSVNRIVNLTAHSPTPAQEEAGVFDVENKKELQSLLTFDTLPSGETIKGRAVQLADIAKHANVSFAMIGGAPFLMAPLERALKVRGIIPLYAFSKRESVEKEEGGKVVKTQVFKHLGFVEVK